MGKKSRRKRSQKKPRQMILSRAEKLQRQLESWFAEDRFLTEPPPALTEELNNLVARMKAPEFLPAILAAAAKAPLQARQVLDSMMPAWMQERRCEETALKLLERGALNDPAQAVAVAWLEAAGVFTAEPPAQTKRSHFFEGYIYKDHSQGIILVFWYTDSRGRKVRGFGFLLDFNPPWEGAIKDVALYPSRDPETARKEFVQFWRDNLNADLKLLSEGEVKQAILKHLEINRREGIRAPLDLIKARREFIDYVLTLEDTPETPPFTEEDFDALARTGKSPEKIMHFEQTVGRRVRLDDGTEIIVKDLRDPDDLLDPDF